jgi:uncharacterized protein YggU (UPF0235/DUF167 family)
MYVHVKVVAGARKESLIQVTSTHFEIIVREPRERNMANNRIKILLANFFQIPHAQVRLLTGHHSSSKIYVVGKSE